MKRLFALLLCAALLLSSALALGGSDPQRKEFRAMWVASVYNLDYPSAGTADPAKLKSEADTILRTCAELGMTAVILQVRPSADALYRSDLFPWSVYLTGTAGKAPAAGFDPLDYWVDKAHELGLELHAWVNPFRITKGAQAEFDALSADSPAVQHPEWVVQHEGNFYFNPGLPAVRELVVQGVEEIIRNYDVDGVHLDDYFYPGKDFDDAETFAAYGAGYTDLGDWRRGNVNQLIETLDQRIHSYDATLSFGVSPSGVWRDARSDSRGSATTGGFESYSSAYADSLTWVKNGWVDYICPQIYWEIGHKSMDYKTIANWWCSAVKGTDVRLYIGMADYRADDGKAGSPWFALTALREQLKLNRGLSAVSGEAHFRYKFFAANRNLSTLYKVWHTAADPEGAVDFLGALPAAEQGHWAAPYYSVLGAERILNGYPDGSFCPDGSVSRGEMAKLVFSALPRMGRDVLAPGGTHPFADLTGHWSEAHVAALWRAGHLDEADYAAGFGADAAMTRVEVVKLLVRALGYTDDGTVTTAPFPDVRRDFFYVEKAVALGLVEGMDDGTFAPDDAVTRGQAAAMLLRAIEGNV